MARILASSVHDNVATISTLRLSAAGPKAAREGAARQLMLAESAGDMGHWQWDVVRDEVTWSPRMFEMHGIANRDSPWPWTAALDHFHPEDRALVAEQLRTAIQGHAGFEFDCRILRGDGTCRTVICKGAPEYDAGGRTIGLYGMLADVTEAFAAIESMQDQKEMLALAAHLAQLGHWVWTREEGSLSFCSDELARIHGLTQEEFMARFSRPEILADAVIGADHARYRDMLNYSLAHACPYTIEYRIETPLGPKDIREIGQPIVGEDGSLVRFVATVQDVTEAKQRENELARAKDELRKKTAELEAANLEKDKLFSIIAHDLRSPFNTVMGFADLLALKADRLSMDQIAAYAGMVRQSAGRVQNLLDNLLAWAAIRLRDGGLALASHDLATVVETGLAPLLLVAQEKDITVANEIGSIEIKGDENLICVVVRNLVSNAIKFSRQGSIVRLSAAASAAEVRVTVHDDGIGLAGETATVFSANPMASTCGTRGEKGTGLGLYLCRDIVERHGGVMTFDSVPAGGTSVHFTLPLA